MSQLPGRNSTAERFSVASVTVLEQSPSAFLRDLDPQLLPPFVGNNWRDAAFAATHDRPQQLEGEFRGKRFYVLESGSGARGGPPEGLANESAYQLIGSLAAAYNRTNRPGGLRGWRSGSSRKGSYGQSGSSACIADHGGSMTLDDKVLRFSAYFLEKNPEGALSSFYYRYAVLLFYLEDNSISIFEITAPNTGLRGGALLRRMRVRADPRQREQYPEDEFVSINHLNVGVSLRLFGVEYILYDCDRFTREFMNELGIVVGDALPRPVDATEVKLREQLRLSMRREQHAEQKSDEHQAAMRAARFMQDGGIFLRFNAVLDERQSREGGGLRRLDVILLAEDNTVAIIERQTTAEAMPALFLSRCRLPKSGSLAKITSLSFSESEKERGVHDSDAYYALSDFHIGMMLSVFGRNLFIYDADAFTREFYSQRCRRQLEPPISVASVFGEDAGGSQERPKGKLSTAAGAGGKGAVGVKALPPTLALAPNGAPEVLRYQLHLAPPLTHDDGLRRFVLNYYTDSGEIMIHESTCAQLGTSGGCFARRRRLPKPLAAAQSCGRGAVGSHCGLRGTQAEPSVEEYYTFDYLQIGSKVVANGRTFLVHRKDAHTETVLQRLESYERDRAERAQSGVRNEVPEERVAQLLRSLRAYLHIRYVTAAAAFRAFDSDKEGVIPERNFIRSLREFQVTWDADEASAAFGVLSRGGDHITARDFSCWLVVTGLEEEVEDKVSKALPASKDPSEVSIRNVAADVPRTADGLPCVATADGADVVVRARVLRRLRERFEARCFTSREMFRMLTTMPRAFKDRRADLRSLTNTKRDAFVTPVQLRRCVVEVLGATITPKEMEYIVSFFFPNLPKEDYTNLSDDEVPTFALDLSAFQLRYNELCGIDILPGGVQRASVIGSGA